MPYIFSIDPNLLGKKMIANELLTKLNFFLFYKLIDDNMFWSPIKLIKKTIF